MSSSRKKKYSSNSKIRHSIYRNAEKSAARPAHKIADVMPQRGKVVFWA